jgi:hypothetical protein
MSRLSGTTVVRDHDDVTLAGKLGDIVDLILWHAIAMSIILRRVVITFF